MDAVRRRATATTHARGGRAPINQLAHLRRSRSAGPQLVAAPDADTLTSVAWLDLSAEPIVLSVPPVRTRYCLIQMLDAWTNVFADPGTRATGNNRADYLITGPRWSGTIASGLEHVEAPTRSVCLIIRLRTYNRRDCAAVRALQQRFTLTPLSAWGQLHASPADVPASPDVDATPSPVDELARIEAGAFFSRLNSLMVSNPPSVEDAHALQRFAPIGIGPGRALDPLGLDAAVSTGVATARALLESEAEQAQRATIDGWNMPSHAMGRYGTDYSLRAVTARCSLGTSLPEDVLLLRSMTDSHGNVLSGANKYRLSFAPGELPPAHAFWSVTMYDDRGALVRNPLDRYALGDLDEIAVDEDGVLSLYLQQDWPGSEKESNWLPAPDGTFNVAIRLYWPTRDALTEHWHPPAIVRVS